MPSAGEDVVGPEDSSEKVLLEPSLAISPSAARVVEALSAGEFVASEAPVGTLAARASVNEGAAVPVPAEAS
jgi:hypothetical protein